jgi:iron complex transport system substrate-binding protein
MAKIILTLCCALAWLAAPMEARARTLTDVFGREVEAPEKVERLIALGSSMCFVTHVGAQGMAVGVEDMEKTESTKPYIIVNRARVKDLPVIGKAGAVRIPNYEEIIRLKPDVIFIVSTERGEPDLIQRKTGVPVFAVGYGITSFDEAMFLKSIELTGEVLGRREQARALTDYIRALPGQLAHQPPAGAEATAYVGGLSYKGHQGLVSTSADFFPLDMAHIKNAVEAKNSPGHLFVNKEYLLAANPPLLFLDGNGMHLIRDGVNSDSAFHERFKALREGDTWSLIPNTSYFMNPQVMYANAFFMAKIAYPEAYADLDPVAKADEIFTAFNGAPLYGWYAEHGYGYARVTLQDGRLTVEPWPAGTSTGKP